MTNPFDRNFFHFLAGFAVVLFISFGVLYFTGRYKDVLDKKNVAAGAEAPALNQK